MSVVGTKGMEVSPKVTPETSPILSSVPPSPAVGSVVDVSSLQALPPLSLRPLAKTAPPPLTKYDLTDDTV